MRYIDFYFEHIHAITPFLHEASFRAAFASRDQQTPAWLGLINMVGIHIYMAQLKGRRQRPAGRMRRNTRLLSL